MEISDLGSSLAANSVSSQSSILVAKKMLDQQKQDGQNALALIQSAVPVPQDGNGSLLNIRA